MVGTYCPVGYDTDRSGMVYLKARRVLSAWVLKRFTGHGFRFKAWGVGHI